MKLVVALILAVNLLAPLLAGCAASRPENGVRSLTASFFGYLMRGDVAEAEALVIEPRGTMRPLLNAVATENDLIPSFSIARIKQVEPDVDEVVVAIPGEEVTTTITLVARRLGSGWKFDGSVDVETRLNSSIALQEAKTSR